MSAILFCGAENSEVLPQAPEDSRRGSSDRLHAIVVRGDTVDEIQNVSVVLAVEDLDLRGSLELRILRPVRSLFLHLSVSVAATFQCLQRLLNGLRYVPVVDHAAPEIDDLVDVLDEERTLLLTRSASGAGPDFVLRENIADQWFAVLRVAQDWIVLENIIPGLDG